MNRWKMSRWALLWCIATVALVATSCVDDGGLPLGPSDQSAGRPDGIGPSTQERSAEDAMAPPPRLPLVGEPEGCALIGPAAGGTVSIGRYRVTVPPGALRTATEIKVTIREAGGHIGCELEPHGITFLRPVTLTMDLSGTDLSGHNDVTIYWYDENDGTWVDMGGVCDPASGRVSVGIWHFSQFRAGRAGW
ncbi:MAG: hypothetical protein FJY88_04880 [Candidatus Eisenbacteria bacterium]|nr:hypothetical protein [Candidatus Eisenbacteria bacterium]